MYLHGSVDDLNAMTAGQLLRETNGKESFAVSCVAVGLFVLITNSTSLLIACLLLCSLGLYNSQTHYLQMYDRVFRVEGKPEPYTRRLVWLIELIASMGKKDLAINMGLAISKEGSE